MSLHQREAYAEEQNTGAKSEREWEREQAGQQTNKPQTPLEVSLPELTESAECMERLSAIGAGLAGE